MCSFIEVSCSRTGGVSCSRTGGFQINSFFFSSFSFFLGGGGGGITGRRLNATSGFTRALAYTV